MRNSLILSLFLVFFFCGAEAQSFLYLKKKGTAKTVKIKLGDKVKIKTKDGEFAKGQLLVITKDAIQVEGLIAELEDLVFIRKFNVFTQGVGTGLISGGAFMGAIFLANGLIINEGPVLTQGNLIFVGSLLVAGGILELLAMHTYRVNTKWNMEVITFPQL